MKLYKTLAVITYFALFGLVWWMIMVTLEG
jgi:hypothetical protein